jgi:hypothetical protein
LSENPLVQPQTKPSHLPHTESNTLKLPPGQALDQINRALGTKTPLKGFLPAAENKLLEASDEFTGMLGVEAIRIAEYRHATAVDREDVIKADKKLREAPDPGRQGWIIGLAGFTGGSGAAALIAVLLAPGPVSHVSYWSIAITSLITVSILLFLISYPWKRRR